MLDTIIEIGGAMALLFGPVLLILYVIIPPETAKGSDGTGDSTTSDSGLYTFLFSNHYTDSSNIDIGSDFGSVGDSGSDGGF